MKKLLSMAFISVFLASCNGETPTGSNPSADPGNSGEAVTFTVANQIITQRCTVCHSATPSQPGVPAPPAGVAFDTPEQIKAKADRIKQRAVTQKDMPPANRTGMTEEERALIGRWVDQGAAIQ